MTDTQRPEAAQIESAQIESALAVIDRLIGLSWMDDDLCSPQTRRRGQTHNWSRVRTVRPKARFL